MSWFRVIQQFYINRNAISMCPECGNGIIMAEDIHNPTATRLKHQRIFRCTSCNAQKTLYFSNYSKNSDK